MTFEINVSGRIRRDSEMHDSPTKVTSPITAVQWNVAKSQNIQRKCEAKYHFDSPTSRLPIEKPTCRLTRPYLVRDRSVAARSPLGRCSVDSSLCTGSTALPIPTNIIARSFADWTVSGVSGVSGNDSRTSRHSTLNNGRRSLVKGGAAPWCGWRSSV